MVSAESGVEMQKYGEYLNRLISRLNHFQYRTMTYREIVRYSSLLAAVYAQCSEIDVRFWEAYDTMMDVFIHVGQTELALKLGEALLMAKTEKFSEASCEVGITCYFLGDLIRNPYCAAHDFGLSMRYMERCALRRSITMKRTTGRCSNGIIWQTCTAI